MPSATSWFPVIIQIGILLFSAGAGLSLLRSGQRHAQVEITALRKSMVALTEELSKLAKAYAVHEESNRSVDRIVLDLEARMARADESRENMRISIHDLRGAVEALRANEEFSKQSIINLQGRVSRVEDSRQFPS